MIIIKCINILILLTALSISAISQNIVLSANGVTANGKLVKKFDNLANNTVVFLKDDLAEIKLLTQKGICDIKNKDYQQHKNSELFELIKDALKVNSVATLGSRNWNKVSETREYQIQLIDSLCNILATNSSNINQVFRQYITPYCVLEFDKNLDWEYIYKHLKDKFGLQIMKHLGETMSFAEYNKILRLTNISSRSYETIPTKSSLKEFCPIPGNQEETETCSAWASSYVARTICWAIKNNLKDKNDITNQAFSPFFLYEQIKEKDDYNCLKGSSIFKALSILKKEGDIFLTDMEHGCNLDIKPFIQEANNYKIKDFYGLTDANQSFDKNILAIKKAISEKKPVIVSIKAYNSFENKIWNGLLDKYRGDHALCVIGYDNNFSSDDGAVELINSWGTAWGEGGYIWVKYKDFKYILNFAIALYDDILPNPIPIIPPTQKATNESIHLPIVSIPVITEKAYELEGSFTLRLSDSSDMPLKVNNIATRGLQLTSVENMTYDLDQSYPSGTLFKLIFTNNKPAYIYLISTDSKRSSVSQLFPDPDSNISPLVDFNSKVEVVIPENQYIELDKNTGEDYLCVIYSKEQLDIEQVKTEVNSNPSKSFVKIIKEVLADKIVSDQDVNFSKNNISFKARSKDKTVIPIFVKIQHTQL